VTVALAADTPVEAVMTPMSADDARNTIIVAVIVVLGALFYMSRVVEHRWLKTLVQKFGKNDRVLSNAPSPADAS
jgi:hypothetical protein